MTKEHLSVEFRYSDKRHDKNDSDSISKTITIGVFDTLNEAVMEGNKLLSILSQSFEVRYDDTFKENGLFGFPDRLVTNCCYRKKGVEYFAKITRLDFTDSITEVISGAFAAAERYRDFRVRND